jgi:hypothetical protein
MSDLFEPREFFVSIVRSSTQHGLLAGPFATHAEALAMLPAARAEATRLDAWSDFDAFGTCSLPAGSRRRGVLNDNLGMHSKRGERRCSATFSH